MSILDNLYGNKMTWELLMQHFINSKIRIILSIRLMEMQLEKLQKFMQSNSHQMDIKWSAKESSCLRIHYLLKAVLLRLHGSYLRTIISTFSIAPVDTLINAILLEWLDRQTYWVLIKSTTGQYCSQKVHRTKTQCKDQVIVQS